MNAGGRVFLGDLVRALSKTGDTGRTNWTAVAALLGFEFAEPRAEVPKPAVRGGDGMSSTGRVTAAGATTESEADAAGEWEIGELLEFDLARSTSPAQAIVLDGRIAIGAFLRTVPAPADAP